MKIFYTLSLFILFSFVFSSFSIDAGDKERWEIIGHKPVNFKLDGDNISLRPSSSLYTSVRFVVKKGKIKMHHCKLSFGNGETQTIPMKKTFTKGKKSRIIDLPGAERKIIKAEFFYMPSIINQTPAHVELWASKRKG